MSKPLGAVDDNTTNTNENTNTEIAQGTTSKQVILNDDPNQSDIGSDVDPGIDNDDEKKDEDDHQSETNKPSEDEEESKYDVPPATSNIDTGKITDESQALIFDRKKRRKSRRKSKPAKTYALVFEENIEDLAMAGDERFEMYRQSPYYNLKERNKWEFYKAAGDISFVYSTTLFVFTVLITIYVFETKLTLADFRV